VAIVSVVLSVAAWHGLQQQDRARLDQQVRTRAERHATVWEEEVHHRVRALERMAARWENHGGTPRDEWEADAGQYARDFPDQQALLWIDPDHVVAWGVTPPVHRHIIAVDVGEDDATRRALETLRRQGGGTRYLRDLFGGALVMALPLTVDVR